MPKAEAIPKDQKIFSKMVEKEITKNFIMKDGKKVEVFKNEKGEFYEKDASGKIRILDKEEVEKIVVEKKIVKLL